MLYSQKLLFSLGNIDLQVHAEVHHGPVDALLQVLLLLENEGVMIEELLKLFVAKVDAKLLESVVLFDEKTER